jgi:hypothetical protein
MSVNLSPVFGVAGQLFDNNGNPLAGGKIFTYAAGTTTPATTYTASSGTIAHSNPIVLDGAGRVPSGEIWLTDGIAYKFVVEDSTSALIGTYDNLVGINSNFVSYTSQQEIQTATAGQTVFTLTTMQYQPSTNNLSVFVDGVNQYGPGAQYAFVETNSTTVTFVTGLHVGALVKFTTASPVATNVTTAQNVSYEMPGAGSVTLNVFDKFKQFWVSVKDYGAVGDGVTDDTVAIQDAVNYANSLIMASQNGAGNPFNAAIKGVYFPHGVYLTSNNIDIPGFCQIYGDEAKIQQNDPTKDVMSCGRINITNGAYIDGAAYLMTIRGLTFVGGRRHLVLANNNLDSNQLRIEECMFYNSANFAIDVVAISGQLKIDKCKFVNNARVARIANDMKEFSDCWFDGNKSNTQNTTQIVNAGGTLYFYRCIGVPGTQLNAAWVADYQNHVQMYNCRWGDEGGNGGWPLIHAFGCPDTSTRYSPAIVIRDCYTGGGLNSARADASLVWCTYPASDGLKRVPPIIIIDNVTKVSSSYSINTNMTDGEFNTAVNLHLGLTYYDVNKVQQETFGISANMATPVKQRSLRRREMNLSSTAGTNRNLFRHFITQQMLANQNSVMKIRYSGNVVNNANSKSILLYLNNNHLSTLTYSPASGAATDFFGEIIVTAPDEYNLIFTHRVTDTTGVKVVAIENWTPLNIINSEYYLDINTTGATAGDIVVEMLDVEIAL